MIFSRRRFLVWLAASSAVVCFVVYLANTVKVEGGGVRQSRRVEDGGAGRGGNKLIDERDVAK